MFYVNFFSSSTTPILQPSPAELVPVENIFEGITAENISNLKETDIKIKEAERVPKKVEPKHFLIIKMAKVKGKDRIQKTAR